jgi:hypothetical protein
MKPDPPIVLNGIIAEFSRYLVPEVRNSFSQGVMGMGLTMLYMIGQEYDRAAARLVEEDDAVAALLQDATYSLPAGDLADRVRTAISAPRHADLRVSALEHDNARLRALLIEVHAAIESVGGEEARTIEERIWAELQESTRRRHIRRGPA